MSFEGNVSYLTSQALYEAIRVCETLPGYRVLVCVDSEKTKAEFLNSVEELFNDESSHRRPRRARLFNTAQYGEDFILFGNKSMVFICTDLKMNLYFNFDIHMALIHDKCNHPDAAFQYAKAKIAKYAVPSEYETNRETFADRLNRHLYETGLVKPGIDTDAMDDLLEGF